MAYYRNRRKRRLSVVVESLEVRRLLSANLVISEFMASNSTTLADQAGDYSDWIEIHNAGDSDANLNNYFLTDNATEPEEWRFPNQTLAAGAYLVVFADNQNISVAGQELHTNFKLSASGEYLALINAADDSVQFAYSPEYPVQTSDISYGLSNADDPNSALVYFDYPTPGAANTPSIAEPIFSQAGTVFTGTLTLSLTDSSPGAVIHYTTDNSAPTASSPVYTQPIVLNESTPIRAMATATGQLSSPVVSQTYERVDSTVTSVQNQNLPIIIIDTYGNTINDSTYVGGSATVMNTSPGGTNILGTADYQGRIGIHIRGSTSEGYPKQQYTVKLWDENNDSKKVALLGMPADSTWVLYAPYTERSLMQNQLAYQWANETGHYAPKTQFVEVYMSTANNSHAGNTSTINYASNYMGVYILEEKIKIDDNRVDVDEMSAGNPNGGFIVQQDRYSGEDYFVTPQGVHMVLEDPDDTSLMSNISSAWDSFENALFTGAPGPNQPWDTPGNADYYGNYIDVQSFADYFLLQEMTRNIDAFWLSTFYTKAADTVVNGQVTQHGLISAGPVWDFNLSLGAANYNFSADSDGWDTDLLSPYPGAAGVNGFNPQDPYFQRLLTDPNFVQELTDRWDTLRQGPFSTQNLISDIQSDVNLLSANTGVYPVGTNPTGTTSPVMRNFQKWPELGQYVTTIGMYDPNGAWIQDVGLMQNWLIGRVNWMDSQFMPLPSITPGGRFTSPVTVNMTPLGMATTTDTQIIGPDSPIQYMVPSSSNNPSGWYLPDYDSSSWSTGTTGIGYDRTASPVNFLPYINTNVQSQMLYNSASIYTRMTFTLSDPSSIQALILKAQYDDGFIAWINGVRVMDANSPENIDPNYRTASADSGDDNQAITFREFDITSVKNLLVAGTNVLAIQGLNSGDGSNDFLLTPALYSRTYQNPTAGTVYYTTDGTDPRGADGQPTASAIAYTGPLTLSDSTEIKARTVTGSGWSGLADQVYNLSVEPLRISEMMYNPPPMDGFSTQDFEFVEVQNYGSAPLDLNGYAFTDGITFTFPDVTLSPGQYGVVVKDPASFAARYGTVPNVLGTYSGSLDNGGEHVEIDDAFGQSVVSFTYDDAWYPTTDGGGYSLVATTNDTTQLSDAAGWRASDTIDGAPGFADSDSVVPTVTSWSINDDGTNPPSIQLTFNTYVSAGSPATLNVIDALTAQPVTVSGFAENGSTLSFLLDASLPSGAYQFTLPAGAAVNASDVGNSTSMTGSMLMVRPGQSWTMPGDLAVNQLSVGDGGTLDVGNAALTIQYGNGADPIAAIPAFADSGFALGKWTGTGIISSAADSSTGVGYYDSNSQIVIARARYGDANVNGKVDADDYALMMLGRQTNGIHWQDGNFNYDAKVDADDWMLLILGSAQYSASPAATLPAANTRASALVNVAPAAAPAFAEPATTTAAAHLSVLLRSNDPADLAGDGLTNRAI